MNEKEKKIKEQRLIEASKKGLSGPDGKFGQIVKNLGQPIIRHNSGDILYDSNYLDDPWEINDKNQFGELKEGDAEYIQKQIPHAAGSHDEPVGMGWKENRNYEQNTYTPSQIGWHFDGLSRGMHLEIKYMEEKNKLTVHYRGYLVYCETSGDLTSYIPNDEWEANVDKLYKLAKDVAQEEKENIKEQKIEKSKKNRKNWLKKMRQKWGI